MHLKYVSRILTRAFTGCLFISGIYFLVWMTDRRVTTPVFVRDGEDSALKTSFSQSPSKDVISQFPNSAQKTQMQSSTGKTSAKVDTVHRTSVKLLRKSPESEHGVCSFEFRQQRIRDMCEKSPPPRRNTKLSDTLMARKRAERRREGPALTAVLFDHRRKVLGCTISKVASTSWIRYMAINSLNDSAVVNKTTVVKRYKLRQYGLTNEAAIPVSDLLKPKYNDWKKYLIVRHPIQRVVSAYYEAIRKLKRFNFSFLEYMEKLGNGEIVDEDEHWALYSSWCHACEVKYDYILKMETLDDDLPVFNRGVGIDENATLPDINYNYILAKELQRKKETAADEYIHKYDKHLTGFQREHPEVFQKVLDLYQHDMDSYGYRWEPRTNSSCGFDGRGGGCC